MAEPQRDYFLLSNESQVYVLENDVFINGKSWKQEDPSNETAAPEKLLEIAQDKMRSFYSELLKNAAYKNLIILSGAGISKEGSKKRHAKAGGEDRDGLWRAAEKKVTEPVFNALKEALGFNTENDLEELLSKAYMLLKFNEDYFVAYDAGISGEGEAKKEEKKPLKDIIEIIEKSIVDECWLEVDGNLHSQFLDKVVNRSLKLPRVKFFTTNYDTLIEQAAQQVGVTLIDGFSFTMPRQFSGTNFDYDIVYREKSRIKNEESFVPKVLHLYKMHGSLDWFEGMDGDIIVADSTNKGEESKRRIIYPASNKYESSYEQPYFEMMSRFQSYLRQENTLLIVVGFSLYDKHISNVIFEAVSQNPNFTLLICNYYKCLDCGRVGIPIEGDSNLKRFIGKENVYIINEKFSDFVNNYPSNKVYSSQKTENHVNQPVQP